MKNVKEFIYTLNVSEIEWDDARLPKEAVVKVRTELTPEQAKLEEYEFMELVAEELEATYLGDVLGFTPDAEVNCLPAFASDFLDDSKSERESKDGEISYNTMNRFLNSMTSDEVFEFAEALKKMVDEKKSNNK